jgi:hypothetical protein
MTYILWVPIGLLFIICLISIVVLKRELKYAASQSNWEHARNSLLGDVVKCAMVIGHKLPTSSLSTEIGLGSKTLVEQIKLLKDQEEARATVVRELNSTIDDLKNYEMQNPQPEPPTYFGKRLPV